MSCAPDRAGDSNVISLPHRYGSSPPPNSDIDGSRLAGQTRIRDRWFGIPAVEEKVIDDVGKVIWRRARPEPRPLDPLCVASYLSVPLAWFALLAWLWSRL